MLKGITVNKSGEIVITMNTNSPTVDGCPLSKSGKSKVISTTGGFAKVSTEQYGMVGINLNITAAQ
tara:strand:- start:299 stop:496 length:198 start_codon:yes stop_codon:yes gene_type:complete